MTTQATGTVSHKKDDVAKKRHSRTSKRSPNMFQNPNSGPPYQGVPQQPVVYHQPAQQGHYQLTDNSRFTLDWKMLTTIIGLVVLFVQNTWQLKALEQKIVEQEQRRTEIEQVRQSAVTAERQAMAQDLNEVKNRLVDIQAYMSNVKASLAAAGVANPDGTLIRRQYIEGGQ